MRSLIVAIALLCGWLWVLWGLVDAPRYTGLGGAAAILLVWYFVAVRSVQREVVCPACQHSLVERDRWSVFVRACPHCGASFEDAR